VTYRVVITAEAKRDLRIAYNYIRNHAPRAASDWRKRAIQTANSLAHQPERCSVAPESASFDEDIRELFFGTGNRGTYRILFTVIEKTVYVLHVRHGSMMPLEPED